MEKRLYVEGLSDTIDDGSLRELFRPFGVVAFVKVIKDFHTGKSSGFGLVEMGTREAAKAAFEALHRSVHDHKTITVAEVAVSS